jgi:hypothetical protein
VRTEKTRREELALAVLHDAITAAHNGGVGRDIGRIRRGAHNHLLRVLRYYGKTRWKPTGRKSGSMSSRRPGANTEAVCDREAT